MDRPRDVMLNRLLQDDANAEELYSMLPSEVQSMVQQSSDRLRSVNDVEKVAQDYLDEI